MIIRLVAQDGAAADAVSVSLTAEDAKNEPRTISAQLNSSVKVDLPAGVWYLDVRNAGLWHQRQAFAAPSAEEISVDVWPRATIAGRLSTARSAPPSELMIYVRRADGGTGEARCLVAGDRFSCPVPAGPIDARIRARGYIARYFPGTTTAPAETRDVGEVALQRGSSIVGWVKAPAARMAEIRVAAALVVDGASQRETIATTPSPSGFFHLDGIEAGEYRIEAVLTRDRQARPVTVIVQRDTEIEIEEPLVVHRRTPMRVSLTPPLDPSGGRWRLQIDEQRAGAHFETLDRRLAAEDGHFVSSPLIDGEYRLSIEPSTGGVWHERTVQITGDSPDLQIDVPVHRVRGMVRLGDMPLAAEIRFEAIDTLETGRLRSNEQGEFAGFLPGATSGRWTVRVRAEHPRASRTFRNVGSAGDRALDFVLPASGISGAVKRRDGTVVWPATVNIRATDERLLQTTVERDGSFSVHGLAPGSYAVSATALDMESAVQEVSVDADPTVEGSPVVLVLDPQREVQGTVISRLGPVAGASVLVFPVDTVPALGTFFETTDHSGRFKTFVPAGTHTVDVHVAAPGLTYSAGERQLKGPDLPIVIDERSGTLTVTLQENGVRAVLLHDGSTIDVEALSTRWTGRERVEGGRRITVIPQMAPGDYALCALPASSSALRVTSIAGLRCVTATLPPLGTATMTIGSEP